LSNTTASRSSAAPAPAAARSWRAEDVEGQQHVVSDAGLGEHLDLAELLAGDA